MSRWKDTLCGSVILGNSSQQQTFMPSHQSEVLSCGGNFLPQNAPQNLATFKKPMFITLPKDEHEIMVCQQNNVMRYGQDDEDIAEELEMIEAALANNPQDLD
ncbi:hypothetical protein K1X76_05940 [bacterium]|nr:hypothetical protein [bacterium]